MLATKDTKKIVQQDKVAVLGYKSKLANDPVLVKKREFAAEFIRKHGLPEHLEEKQRNM